ncbi:MAG: zinc ribbon domain-containing protein [Lachnospiraceae bacterium]|nr:zinc ribbon domain-containing protein [Lachnospiraceae bacterium]
MQCKACGRYITKDGALYCPQCGALLSEAASKETKRVLYKLANTEGRNYEIIVNESDFIINGEFWYLKDKDFYASKTKRDIAHLKDFIGMGYLAKRSYRKTLLFVFGGSVLELIKVIIDKITDLIDKANDYLQWINQSVSMPTWMTYTLNITAGICVFLGIILFFSKKKVIEISFTNKRICVPQKSMTQQEYAMLYKSIQKAKKHGGKDVY